MTDLPDGWEWTRLEELLAAQTRAMTDGPFGSNLKSAHYVESGPRVIRLQNIGFGQFIDARAHIAQEHFEKLRAHEVVGGDLVVASLGEDLPRACIIPDAVGPAIVKADCIRVRLHPGIDRRYVDYAMQRPALRRAVRDQVHGVGRPRLGMGGIRELAVPLPPLAEQRRIVAAVEERLSQLDAAEAGIRSARSRLTQFIDAGLESIFDRGWDRVPLDSVNESDRPICYGILKPKTAGRAEIPYVEVRSIAGSTIKVHELHKTTTKMHKAFLRSELRVGDVVMAIRGSFDRAAVVPDSLGVANVSRDVARISPRAGLLPSFLASFLVSPEARTFFRKHARGVAVQGINIGDLRRLPVPLPTKAVQGDAVSRIDAVLIAAECIRAELQTAERRSRHLRRSILAAAFSGQLVPQCPADEPASVLLQRIRAEGDAHRRRGRSRKVIA